MATLLRHGKVRIVIYSEDHRPSHVHVVGVDKAAVLQLNCQEEPHPHGPLALRENHGFTARELRPIIEQVEANLTLLCAEWKRVHGDYR
ncbi:DUF4160 domain-containing protein [Caulobacter vibrioides]|uniref:DUF4160 domain-containing protein n=1 Tax=Caulobacter vibrioides TaxID=155892 RepID=A0A290MZ35_CAUVI|nr:DUF4160 domain-containing protein [Caulobacter vibrioides]ATC34259.1 DUF4160 domain-containing protein [Caulobacter vibrioides]